MKRAGSTTYINEYTNTSIGTLPMTGFDGEDSTTALSYDTCVKIWGPNVKADRCTDEGACGLCFLKERNQTLTLKGIRDEDVYDNVEFDREYYPYGYREHHILFQ